LWSKLVDYRIWFFQQVNFGREIGLENLGLGWGKEKGKWFGIGFPSLELGRGKGGRKGLGGKSGWKANFPKNGYRFGRNGIGVKTWWTGLGNPFHWVWPGQEIKGQGTWSWGLEGKGAKVYLGRGKFKVKGGKSPGFRNKTNGGVGALSKAGA